MIRKFFLTFISTGGGWGMLPLRLIVGATFMAHGSQKLFGLFGGPGLLATAEGFQSIGLSPGLFWATVAGSGEFFGGLLLLLGLLTRFGAFNIGAVMTVAVVHVHWGKFFAPHGMEYPLALWGVAVSLLISGGGRLSVDRLLSGWMGAKRRAG